MSKMRDDLEQSQQILEQHNADHESAAMNQMPRKLIDRGVYTEQQFQRDRKNFNRQHGKGDQ